VETNPEGRQKPRNKVRATNISDPRKTDETNAGAMMLRRSDLLAAFDADPNNTEATEK
jgi:hypothetical protein